MIGAIELGLIYGVMALGVYLTFRVLNFPDLTVDGSFTTGAAVAASLITAGQNPILATLAGGAAGLVAGVITGLLHTKGKIDGLLAGILTMIALWSINLRIMDKANLPLLRSETIFTPLKDAGVLGTWGGIGIILVGVIVLKLVIDWFLSTDLGLAIQATGNNEQMIRSFGVNTDGTKILTLALSNGLVALCGALVAQYQGFADISMGIGLILIGLASVILGQAIFGQRFIWLASLAVVFGAVLYRLIIFFALQAGLNPNDMKLVTAVLVVAALLLPRWGFLKKLPSLRDRGNRRQGDPAPDPVASATTGVTVPVER
ncbi:ABC transporter permease [Leucobacter luti]|uniref:Putative ABC transport system permease protein n=1 Tax=Leucobacter luti TaxID=340320 RepID=A0A4R6S293_9MICO|nr:ABC transporter permease [Leucobacter luti]MCW2289446.1 putative ABC transport system permease protein [Leucobacter luti]QYM74787.1 ABC transporter permease [Leucobacter luti]TCK40005.1 putative ABC transport system permease protein [Leucobacter luti]TDP93137.1 putative ABC transport system permease protein [Leucobacter luti]